MASSTSLSLDSIELDTASAAGLHRIIKMKTRAWLLCFIPLCLSINATPLEAVRNCQQAFDNVSTEQDSLSELKRLRDELEIRFQEYCKEDFSAQVEGIANELHRNKAIKVAFAKRRLTKLIDSRSRQLTSST